MKRLSKVLIVVVLSIGLITQTNFIYALTINPIIINPNIPIISDVFSPRHEVIKAVPIYRTYINSGYHKFTTSEQQYILWNGSGGYLEVAGYISPVPLPYTVPMWNMMKPYGADHYFVVTEEEHDNAIAIYGYKDLGIMGHVVPLGDKDHGSTNMYQWFREEVYEDENHQWYEEHYYNNAIDSLKSYIYEGPRFRVWSNAAVLQEVNVISPNGGEALTADTNVDIKWNTLTPGGKISLYYTLNPTDGWSKIADNIDNTGSYTWKVPNSITEKAIVEARWTYEGIDANCFDQSDKYFSIKAGRLNPTDWSAYIKPLNLDLLLQPATPTNLSAYSDDTQKYPKLSWKDNATNETAYVIERVVENGGAYSQLAKLNANAVEYTDNGAEKGKIYYYRVKAVNNILSSAYSNEVGASVFELIMPDLKPDNQLPAKNEISMLFTINQGNYLVNGESKTMDVSPVVINGRTLLPIRFVADPLGAVTEWKQDEQKVTVTLGSIKLELWINNNVALVNGKSIIIDPNNLDVKPIIMNNRTMLPMRFVAEKLGCKVEWLAETSQAKIDKLDPQPEPPIQ